MHGYETEFFTRVEAHKQILH